MPSNFVVSEAVGPLGPDTAAAAVLLAADADEAAIAPPGSSTRDRFGGWL